MTLGIDIPSLEQILAAVVFVGMRMAGVMTFAPFFGSDGIPRPVKAGFTVLLTALLYPVSGVTGLALDVVGWVRVAAQEAVIGLLLGLALQFIFEAAQVAGQVAGIQAGFSLVTILDPQTQADTPVLSIFHQLIVLLIFLRLEVHHWLLRALAASFAYLPPGTLLQGPGLARVLLHAAGTVWLVGVEMAAPVIAATLLADIALGFLGKASPQLPVVFVGLSIKSMLGLMVLGGSLALWPRLLEKHFRSALLVGERLLHLAG